MSAKIEKKPTTTIFVNNQKKIYVANVAIVTMNRSERKDITIFIERFIATILTKSKLLLGVIFRSDAVI